MDFTWTHLIRLQVSLPWPGALTSLTVPHAGFYPFPSNYFTSQLPNKHSPCPHFPLLLHMKEANHQCDLPLFTSDPPDTRITTTIPAVQTLWHPPQPPPQLGGCFSPLQMTDERSRGCQTPLLASPRAHRGMKQEDVLALGSDGGKGLEMEVALT